MLDHTMIEILGESMIAMLNHTNISGEVVGEVTYSVIEALDLRPAEIVTELTAYITNQYDLSGDISREQAVEITDFVSRYTEGLLA